MKTDDLAAELREHEAVCAERWKTVFNQLKDIERRSANRFDSVETSITRIETILIGVTGAGLTAAIGVIWALLSMG